MPFMHDRREQVAPLRPECRSVSASLTAVHKVRYSSHLFTVQGEGVSVYTTVITVGFTIYY
jgi:hypothetical protein